MAPGRRISRPFLLVGFTVGEGGLRTRAGDSAIMDRRGQDSPVAARSKGESRRLQGETPLRARVPRARSPAAPAVAGSAPPTPLRRGQACRALTRADQTPRGAQPLQTQRRAGCSAAPQPPHPLLAAGPALPLPGRAIPPPTPGRPAPGLTEYLSSNPRRAPGRPRPRGDIRVPASGSRPHLQAPAAAGEAPRPAPGGGSAGRRRCPGSRPPLRSVRLPA